MGPCTAANEYSPRPKPEVTWHGAAQNRLSKNSQIFDTFIVTVAVAAVKFVDSYPDVSTLGPIAEWSHTNAATETLNMVI